MKVKKDKSRKIFISIILIAAFTILTIIFFTVQNIITEKTLSDEVDKLSTMDIMSDTYEVDLKTKGNYKKVERAIKTYFRDYSKSLQIVLNILNDEKLKTVLSAENYKADGKDFVNTLGYLDKTKTDFKTNMEILINLNKQETIMNYIKQEEVNDHYVKIYKNYMFDEGLEITIKNSKLQLETTTASISNLIDVDIEVINFLIGCKDNWDIEENEIAFYKQELLDIYNALIQKANQ